jgi:general secretion pathway protein D
VVTYVDVGLKLEVEPTIFLNGEVAIKVSLDVTNIVGSETIPKTDTTVYTVGNRNASTTLRLKDGENQILAGLINNDSDRSVNKLPGLGDSPLLGRLFGSQKNIEKKTEILLSITPRLVRNLQRQEASINEFLGGTDSNLRLRPDFKVGALEEVIANPEINREAVPVPAQAVASPSEPAAQPPQPAPELPPVIQLTDTDSAAKPEAVQAKPDPKAKAEELKLKQAQAAEEKKQLQEQKRAAAAKAREEKAEELKLKQAQAAEEKKQLQEQKRAAAAKAREEKLLEKKKPVDKNKASPETRQFIDNIMKQNEAP